MHRNEGVCMHNTIRGVPTVGMIYSRGVFKVGVYIVGCIYSRDVFTVGVYLQ